MKYCCITRRATNLKWKGNFISRDILTLAQMLSQRPEFTSRKAIQTIQNEYSHYMEQAKHSIPHGDNKALSNAVRGFLREIHYKIENNIEFTGAYRA